MLNALFYRARSAGLVAGGRSSTQAVGAPLRMARNAHSRPSTVINRWETQQRIPDQLNNSNDGLPWRRTTPNAAEKEKSASLARYSCED
ncbi:hypothetical protein V6N11_074162 [Hibiscus sabdariffa]|uniref:Uncharacterized protein n=1 Tax=Hibiscus sabdariffa TaxID=183260 RepID=A0ABR2NWU6_9ROSI